MVGFKFHFDDISIPPLLAKSVFLDLIGRGRGWVPRIVTPLNPPPSYAEASEGRSKGETLPQHSEAQPCT
jgi:hypothetical protein